ncbi:MAG: helix-turn-helix transcriptional regulator [Lachnospiraceae bacterium]|nr:helix-turn-helix transcriptional regulator [Lachnospiraceae bacterium]
MKISKKDIFYTILFTEFLLTYMIVLAISDDYARSLSDTGSYMLHYSPGIMRILGFASFWLSRRFITGERIRRLILIAADTIFIISAALLIGDIKGTGVIIVLFALSFSLGHLGGLIYYCISAAFSVSTHKGRIIGFSCAASILLQFLLDGLTDNIMRLVIAAVIFLLISYLTLKTPADFILEDPLPYAGDSEAFTRNVRLQLIAIVSVVIICGLLACRTDIAFLSMSYSGDVNIYSYPRLAMVAGYIIMGIVADMKDHKLTGTVFFSGMLLSAVLVLMPFVSGDYGIFLSVYYFFISLYIFFYTYSFISVAPRTHAPELWASIGRPLSDLCVAPISFIMLKIGNERLNASPIYYALYYFLLLIILYILTSMIKLDPNLAGNGPAGTDSKDQPAQDSDRGADSRLDMWLDEFPLTPRERDVARLLINTDKPIKAIASELDISERSVYRYASSIYEKTGIDNRTGLIKNYMS